MKHELIQTSDGSTSLYIADLQETYHSKHGALQETLHVFIHNGLQLFREQAVSILEIGFGTGLNALVTYLKHTDLNLSIRYETVEAYPLSWEEASLMNFPSVLYRLSLSRCTLVRGTNSLRSLLLSASKNGCNALKRLTTPLLSTLFTSMLLAHKYNLNSGRFLSSKRCIMP